MADLTLLSGKILNKCVVAFKFLSRTTIGYTSDLLTANNYLLKPIECIYLK